MAQRLVKKVWDEGAQTISFMWYEKDKPAVPMTATDGTPIIIDLKKVSPEMLGLLALHGATQKVSDTFAGAEKDANGDATAKRALIVGRIMDAAAALYDGTAFERESSGVERVQATLYRALADLHGLTVDRAKARYEKLTDEQKAAIRKDPNVRAKQAEIKLADERAKAATAKPTVDVAALFAEA